VEGNRTILVLVVPCLVMVLLVWLLSRMGVI
jgi:hypothetical protein